MDPSPADPDASVEPFDPTQVDRPDRALLTYYILVSALTFIGFPFVFLPLYFKYHTLRYKFDDKGVSMSYGILFRREIYLTYRRIQDTHLTRNLFHRWLGLAAVSIQTASGTSGAEMTIEGLRNAEGLRDFLYARMRGAEMDADETAGDEPGSAASPATAPADEALSLLREIRDELKSLRREREGDP